MTKSILLTLTLLISSSYADTGQLLCYYSTSAEPKQLQEFRTNSYLTGVFQDVNALEDPRQTIFITKPNINMMGRSNFYFQIWTICNQHMLAEPNGTNLFLRGYAVAKLSNGAVARISNPSRTLKQEIYDMPLNYKSIDIFRLLSLKAFKVIRNGAESTMTDKDFFDGYTDDTYKNTYIMIPGAKTTELSRLSTIVGPLAMTHPTREELKRRLTTFIYLELNHHLPNSAKASQAAASLIINFAKPIGNLLATATESSLYITKLDNPTKKLQTFEIKQEKGSQNKLTITATASVAYPGYITAAGQNRTTPFAVDFSIPFEIDYSNYRNNDYKQLFPAMMIGELLDAIVLTSTDKMIKDDIVGAWLDYMGKPFNYN